VAARADQTSAPDRTAGRPREGCDAGDRAVAEANDHCDAGRWAPAPEFRAMTGRREGLEAIHPSGLPLARDRPDGTDRRFGFPLGFAPRRPRAGRRTPGWGQAIEHGPGTTSSTSHQPILRSCSSLNACDLASHHGREKSRACLAWRQRQKFGARRRMARRSGRRNPEATNRHASEMGRFMREQSDR
jgi:hypothetical protein